MPFEKDRRQERDDDDDDDDDDGGFDVEEEKSQDDEEGSARTVARLMRAEVGRCSPPTKSTTWWLSGLVVDVFANNAQE